MADEKMLNGLRPDKIKAITDSMRDDPEVLKGVTGPWKSRVVWQGGFRAKAYMRKHVVEMDEPEGLDATDAAASAHEQLLSAMGSCLTVGFVLNATKRGVRIHDLEVALEGNFENILKWAGHSTERQSRLSLDQGQAVRARRRRRKNAQGIVAARRRRLARHPDHRAPDRNHHRVREGLTRRL